MDESDLADNIPAAVVYCTNGEMTDRHWTINDDYKMSQQHGFTEQNIGQFLNNIKNRLTAPHLRFSFNLHTDGNFIRKCVPLTLGQLKDAIIEKTSA
jgi:hypothetical protein